MKNYNFISNEMALLNCFYLNIRKVKRKQFKNSRGQREN